MSRVKTEEDRTTARIHGTVMLLEGRNRTVFLIATFCVWDEFYAKH